MFREMPRKRCTGPVRGATTTIFSQRFCIIFRKFSLIWVFCWGQAGTPGTLGDTPLARVLFFHRLGEAFWGPWAPLGPIWTPLAIIF